MSVIGGGGVYGRARREREARNVWSRSNLKECVGIKSEGKERQYVTTVGAKERQGECLSGEQARLSDRLRYMDTFSARPPLSAC
jgi:hypothetical protein